jgi:Flp pilus assembly protein TadG
MMNGSDRGFLSLLRDRQGNVLPIAAVGMILTAALVGGGVDMSRAYRVENRLQSACDSAVLAGRRAVASSGYDTTAKAQAESYFATNFNDATQETATTTFASTTPDNGQTIAGVAKTQLNLAVMKIFGFQKFSLEANCSASMGVGNSDVVMVLDTTGSMGNSLGSGTRITALRTAMKNFYTTVKTATTGSNSRIRYGFVPFSSSVNVGRLLTDENPAYLVDTWDIQSREQVQKWDTPTYVTASEARNVTYGEQQLASSTDYSENNCKNGYTSTGTWDNNGNSTSTAPNTIVNNDGEQVSTWTTIQPQRQTIKICIKNTSNNRWYRYYYYGYRDWYTYTTATSERVFDYWNYQPITYDVTAYKAFQSVSTNTGDEGTAVSSVWAGCIEERETVSEAAFTYSTISGITPAGARDLDIDSAPTSDNASKWAPMWPEVAYYRLNSSGNLTNSNPPSRRGGKAGSYCPYQSKLLGTMSQAEFNSYADSLFASGSTYLDIGMAWGGRISSPQGIFKDGVNEAPTNGGEVSRHVIFMSDGQMEPSYSIQSAWGIEYHDQRVTDNGTSNDASRHTSRFLALCAAIKAKGIRIWTISFTTGTSADLTTCASPKSAFNADDATELNSAFQEIAKQVGELRITQ